MSAYNQISMFSYPFFNKASCYCWALGFYGFNLSLVFTYMSLFFAFSAKYPESSSWVSREEETRERQFSCVYWLRQTRQSLRSDIGGQLSIFWLAKTELIDLYSGIHHSKQAFQTPLMSLFKWRAKICFGAFVLWTWMILHIVWLVSFLLGF